MVTAATWVTTDAMMPRCWIRKEVLFGAKEVRELDVGCEGREFNQGIWWFP